MQLGVIFIWTCTCSLMQNYSKLYHKIQSNGIQCLAKSDEEVTLLASTEPEEHTMMGTKL
jgi:hypothetical protein